MFMADFRAEFKINNPRANTEEAFKAQATRWKSMAKEEKDEYQRKADQINLNAVT